jgi:transposase InsO family protein
VPSVGSVGDSSENARAETINGLYKAEVKAAPTCRAGDSPSATRPSDIVLKARKRAIVTMHAAGRFGDVAMMEARSLAHFRLRRASTRRHRQCTVGVNG